MLKFQNTSPENTHKLLKSNFIGQNAGKHLLSDEVNTSNETSLIVWVMFKKKSNETNQNHVPPEMSKGNIRKFYKPKLRDILQNKWLVTAKPIKVMKV